MSVQAAIFDLFNTLTCRMAVPNDAPNTAAVLGVSSESDLRLHHQAALQKVREVVAPVCGAGSHFVCAIGVDWRPQHCALEYVVVVPPSRAREGDNAIWVGLDLHDRVVSVEPKRDLLCHGLRAG